MAPERLLRHCSISAPNTRKWESLAVKTGLVQPSMGPTNASIWRYSAEYCGVYRAASGIAGRLRTVNQ
jgi:hypothetical protein